MDNNEENKAKDDELVGQIPQAVIPQTPQVASPPPVQSEPSVSAQEEQSDNAVNLNPVIPNTASSSVMDEPEVAAEVELPTLQTEVHEPEPAADKVADAPQQVATDSEEKPAEPYSSIWDECEGHEDATAHLQHQLPMFERAEAPDGADIALAPTTAQNVAVLAQAKDLLNPQDLIWMMNLQQAAMVAPTDPVMLKRLMREGSDWTQSIKITDLGGKPLSLAFLPSASKRPSSPGEAVSGDQALERFMAGTTMGAPVTVPLTNTGIWVRLAPAGASYLAEIDRMLAYARMQVGLDTNGITGSTDDLIFREILNEAALKLVTATNFPVKDPIELREVIDDEDHKTLVWALAKVIYPKGIMVSIPCIDPQCADVATFKANPARMHYIDRSKLNDKQLQYLARGITRAMSAEDVADYKAQFSKTSKYSVRILNREFLFRSPTVAEKLQIGRAWLSSVNQAVDKAMASTPDDDMKRSNVIQQITAIEQVCRYGHYIDEIRIYDNDENVSENYFTINGENDIRGILKSLSSAPEIVDSLIEAIEEFLVEIGTTIIGYPNVECNVCHHERVPEKMKNRLILPFDPDTGFFILAQRKILQAEGQPLTDLSTFGVANLAARALESAPMVSLGQD